MYQFRGGKNTRIDITVDAPGGMDYAFLGKTLPFDRVAGHLLFTNDRLQIVDLKAGLFSGSVHGAAGHRVHEAARLIVRRGLLRIRQRGERPVGASEPAVIL